jgi:hypothetical protein
VHVGARGAGLGSGVLAVVGDDVGTVHARASNDLERPPASATASESEQEAVAGRSCSRSRFGARTPSWRGAASTARGRSRP